MDDALPTAEQQRALCELMHSAFVAIRFLCWQDKSHQAADLADVFHNLPNEMHGAGGWNLAEFRRSLQTYQKRYEHPGPDLVEQLDLAFGIAPYDDPDARVFQNQQEIIAAVTRYIQENPEDASWFLTRGELYLRLREYDKGLADLVRATELARIPIAWRDIAWIRAACPDERIRDGAGAIAAAEKYQEMVGRDDADTLEVLAAAHAANGAYEIAAELQAKAIEIWPENQHKLLFQEQLARYRRGEGYVPNAWSWCRILAKERTAEGETGQSNG